jgi:hypothetical protein
MAAERVVNVLIGGIIGYGFVLGVHALREMRTSVVSAVKRGDKPPFGTSLSAHHADVGPKGD